MTDSPSLRAWHRVLVATAVAVAAAYGSFVLLAERDPSVEAGILALGFVVLALLGVVRTLRTGANVADLVFTAGLLLAAIGWAYWAVVLVPLDDPPYPSAADAFWMARFPLAFASLAWHVGRAPAARRALVLDVLIGSAGVTAAVAGFVVPAVASGADDPNEVAVNAVYLGANLSHVLLLISVLAMRGFRMPAELWRQMAAAALLLVTNSGFLVVVAETGVIPTGSLLSVGWLGAFALMVSSIGAPAPTARPVISRSAVLVVPLTGAVLALAVLLGPGVGPSARWIAAAAVLLALGRMGLAFLEAEALAGSHRLAHTDELTGLVNRRGFHDAMRRCLAEGCEASVVLLDLNRFKEINDTLGHHFGDVLLQLVARRLASETRTGERGPDVVARVGGDEFALLLRRSDLTEGERAAHRLLASLGGQYDLGEVSVRSSAAGGLVHLPEHGSDPEELLRRADIAMYAAKGAGVPLEVYRTDLDTGSVADLERLDRLQTALRTGGLVVHYQPKVDLRTGAVLGVEALARMRLDDGTLLLPGEFLSALSRVGDLVDLTEQVLDVAVSRAAGWRAAGHELSVAVDVPTEALVGANLAERVRDALGRHDLPGRCLYLEVTEASLLQDRMAGRASLAAVRELGVRVSIDDYGTGYSSLTYLRELPLDEIKIDKSFVHGLADDQRATRIVHSTALLAHGLDLTVVAEGVETESDRDAALAAGCDLAQGYLFAVPMPAEDLMVFLAGSSVGLPASDTAG